MTAPIQIILVDPGVAIAGRALAPDLQVRAEQATDDIRVTLRLCDDAGQIKVATESLAFDMVAGEAVAIFPVQADPLPTHPAWRGPFWLEVLVTRYGRTLAKHAVKVTLNES